MQNIEDFSKNYLENIKKTIDQIDLEKVRKAVEVIYEAYQKDKQIFIIGNGGSASMASHFTCDLGKGSVVDFKNEKEKRFRVISLSDNVDSITSFGNDLNFEDIFIQQLRNLLNPGDVLIGISTSGNSPNIIRAVEYAKRCGAKTIGLLGFKTGGRLGSLVDYEITVQDEHCERSQDIHMMLIHIMSNYLSELKKFQYYRVG
jgi:D-sedoheptulose 7-phosphate isomerase